LVWHFVFDIVTCYSVHRVLIPVSSNTMVRMPLRVCVYVWCSLTSQTSVETPPPGRSHAATSGLGYAQVAGSHHSQPSMPTFMSLNVSIGSNNV